MAFTRWKRSAAVLAAVAPLAFAASNATAAAPKRTATTTDYTTARFLQDTLGLPSAADHAIEPVTYDHLQWLLQQPGDFALLIGDPALDPTFAARAQDVEATAKANGVERVYWFDPNLSGSVRVGNVDEPNLDIRNPAGITSLPTASQTIYGNAWLNLVGQYLGNGVSIAVTSGTVGDEDTVIKGTTRASVVNDYGAVGTSTKVGDPAGGALYDYTATGADADATDSYFLVYNKDKTVSGNAQRIVSWTNLTEQADATSAKADVDTAIDTVGGANLDDLDQFDWWKGEVNFRNHEQGSPSSGKDVPVLTDADEADGWDIEQITYPQLVHLLKSDARRDAVILFGGTWCPNTRPVLPAINRYAQENNVHVFNFDTVLDGGTVGGRTTNAENPLQIRNTATYTVRDNAGNVISTTPRYSPTFLYGDLVSQYLPNLKTQYTTTGNPVTYNAEAGRGATEVRINKLQVPYLIGYKGSTGSAPHDGVTRQWLFDKGDGTYTEYMTSWAFANPLPNQLGLSIALDAPIWSTINSQLATFNLQTDVTAYYPNTGTDADAAQFLGAAEKARVEVTGSPARLRVTADASGAVDASPAALSAALAALGSSAPANYNAARTAYLAAVSVPDAQRDATLISRLTTVVGAWGVSQLRKTSVINVWGEPGRPGSIVGAATAIRALDVFFGGLPGAVVSTQTVTANTVKVGTAPTISVKVENPYGRTPTGNVSLVVKQGGATVATGSSAVAGGTASFTLPALGAGTYDYTVSYATDDQILGFEKSGTLTVDPADVVVVPPPGGGNQPPVNKPPVVTRPTVKRVKAKSLKGVVVKAPTSKKGGTFKVTVAAPKGGAAASGKVTITLKKGKTAKKITGTLKKGVVTVKLPKLAKGTWKVTIAWPGDARYAAAKATATLKIKK